MKIENLMTSGPTTCSSSDHLATAAFTRIVKALQSIRSHGKYPVAAGA